MTIGERVKQAREQAGLTQRELGRLSQPPGARGASFSYICRIESGQRNPTRKALRLIAPHVGVTAEYLEFGIDTLALVERALDADLANLARLAVRRARRLETT